jgi:hypothetical protein
MVTWSVVLNDTGLVPGFRHKVSPTRGLSPGLGVSWEMEYPVSKKLAIDNLGVSDLIKRWRRICHTASPEFTW